MHMTTYILLKSNINEMGYILHVLPRVGGNWCITLWWFIYSLLEVNTITNMRSLNSLIKIRKLLKCVFLIRTNCFSMRCLCTNTITVETLLSHSTKLTNAHLLDFSVFLAITMASLSSFLVPLKTVWSCVLLMDWDCHSPCTLPPLISYSMRMMLCPVCF